MEREYKTVETPIGKDKVKLKTWLTGGEKRQITNSIISESEFTTDELNKPTFKGSMIQDMQDASINSVIEEINGKTENILETILNMRSTDYEFIIEEINKITEVENEIVKK